VNGYDIMTEPNKAKSFIGYLPEQPPLYPDFTVDESLNFIYALKKVKLDRRKHLDDICDQTSIQDVRHRLTKNLSKGYKQRVGLAMALIGDPPILILDEPTIGLDPVQIVEIRNLIKDLSGSRTVLLSSHILQEIQAVANRIIVIHNGNLVADDTAENLIRHIENPNHTIEFQLAGNKEANLKLLKQLPGVLSMQVVEKENGLCTYTLEVDDPKNVGKFFHADRL
jgi:ABC-2 type transport system ATP-binding protein